MRLVVRTWNVFHGRTVPEGRTLHVERAVRLAAAGDPDVICLQELPVWALASLEEWSGLTALGAVAMPPLAGPLARRLTDADPRRLRSALTGQANAVLLARRLDVPDGQRRVVLNPRALRRSEARRLGLPAHVRVAWGRNRRVAQLVRIAGAGASAVVVNLHLTSSPDGRPAETELAEVLRIAGELATPGEPVLLCGDLNLTPAASPLLAALPAAGFTRPLAGIDQILARGLAAVEGPAPWPAERRRLGDALLSDHAPVEAVMIGP
ncbi:MAG: endonuclease/exonuclease/phosphatase family protein [Thermoleophilia bacterium]|nr:endonuclease/exonuclease/phosphatase family protein [Thermoleophilia bacterium]